MTVSPDRLMQQEEEWKMDVEATLAIKEARARMLQMEKEEMIQEVNCFALQGLHLNYIHLVCLVKGEWNRVIQYITFCTVE